MDENDEVYQQVLKSLDEALQEGPWDKSLFLRATGKKLLELRNNFANEIGLAEVDSAKKSAQQTDEIAPGTAEVYILLYSAEGNNLKRWQNLLSNLENYSVSRPIYRNEDDIKKLIRTKASKANDAYACVRVKESQILPAEAKDRLGNSLLNLPERAIQISNLTRFVHISGIYRLHNGVLEKTADAGLHSWQ